MKKALALPLLALFLSACDVGEGNRPVSIRFVNSTADITTLTSTTAYECFTQAVVLVADFTDGIPGDFTSRVQFVSSDPAVVRVSNADVPVTGSSDLVYSRGILVPVAPGTATISAEFAGLKAALQVTVRRPESLTVTTERMRDSDGVTIHGVDKMVPGSTQQLVATAVLNDGTQSSTLNVTALGQWTDDATDDIATINASTGLVGALKTTTTPIKATVSFPPCSANPPTGEAFDFQAEYEIKAPARKLAIITEPGYPTQNGAMPAGSSQILRVLADFDTDASNGEGQDLTFKGATFTTDTTAVFSYSPLSALLIAGPTASTTPTQITASFGKDDTLLTSDPLSMNVIAATLDSISVSPATTTVTPLGQVQFSATGSFTVNGVAGALQNYPVQHDVTWSSDDAASVVISNFATFAGLATSLKNEATAEGKSVTITARSTGLVPPTATGTTVSATAALRVVAPAATP